MNYVVFDFMLFEIDYILIFHRVLRVKQDLPLRDESFLQGAEAALPLMVAAVRDVRVKHGAACGM